MKLSINLTTRRYINMRLLNTWLAVTALLLTALSLYVAREIATNKAEIDKIAQQSRAASRGTAEGPAVTPEQMKAVEARIAAGNELIAGKTVDWIGLLDKLEGVVPAGVSLTQVTPVPKDESLKISGVARGFDNVRVLLENMEQSPNFSEVYLLSQSEVKVGKTQQGLAFNVSCKVGYK